MMNSTLFLHHVAAHEKAMEEYSSYPQRNLREIQHDARLVDEVDALGPAHPLFRRRKTLDYARCASHFVRRKVPLVETSYWSLRTRSGR
jgi:hypothetical protein